MELTPNLAREFLGGGYKCGRPNRFGEPCGLRRTYDGLPCKTHVTDDDRKLKAFIDEVVKLIRENDRRSRERNERSDREWVKERNDEIARAQKRLGQMRYSIEEVGVIADRDSPARCGRPTADGQACSLNCEPYAPACKWHLEDWEWNIAQVAQRAFFQGLMIGREKPPNG